ncbi:MAG TPA: RNA-binding domain-containing protein [Thermoplasmata archaeon]
MLEVRLVARCFPTEEKDKVAKAMSSLFPDIRLEGDDPIVGTSLSTDRFAEQLKRQKIRDSARAVLRRGIRGNSTSFRINKQVAAVGKISFSEESHPLGDIEVTVFSDGIEQLIDSIAPSTRTEATR